MNFSLNPNANILGSLGGTVTPGDVLTVNVYDPSLSGGTESASYTVLSGDSLSSVATGITSAIAANSDLAAIIYTYTDGGSNITLNSSSVNQTTYRASLNSGATETIVLGTTINGTGCSLGSSQYQYNNLNELVAVDSSGVTQFQGTTSKPVVSGSVITNAMSIIRAPLPTTTYGIPEYSSATETISFSPPLNGNASATVGGTVTAGDVLSILVFNSSLPGGQEQVFYTVTSGDTLSSIATSLASAVNSDTNLAAQGITANASSAVVNITQPSTSYSASTSSGATEYLFLHNNNNGSIVAEIDGTTTTGDILTLTVTDPRLSGSSESVSYTVLSTDNVTTIAGAVAGLINADSNLTNIGIKAKYTAPAKFNWSESFTANQLTPFWNQSVVSATDAVPSTATAQYGIYTAGPNLATPTYDLNGNMTGDGTNTYQWDAENRLVQITYPGTGNYSSFFYDGRGRCAAIKEFIGGTNSSTNQLIWSDENVLEVRDGSSAIVGQYFAYGQTASGQAYFYTRDRLGSIREMTDASSNLKSQLAYDPFGRVSQLAGTLNPGREFAGYYQHTRSGFSLTANRLYNAAAGRWLNRDPIGETGGFNLFAYVRNNPLSRIDPTGLQAEDPCKCIEDAIQRLSQELRDREEELYNDKFGLPKWGQRMSIWSHQKQYEDTQRALQKQLKKFDDNNCGNKGYFIPDDADQLAYGPVPYQLNDWNPFPWHWDDNYDPWSKYSWLPLIPLIPFPGNPLYGGI